MILHCHLSIVLTGSDLIDFANSSPNSVEIPNVAFYGYLKQWSWRLSQNVNLNVETVVRKIFIDGRLGSQLESVR